MLSENELIYIGFKSTYDFSQKENLLEILERKNWPISKKDIEAVEHEIHLAEIYLQQSKALREYLLNSDSEIFIENSETSEKPAESPTRIKSELSNKSTSLLVIIN